MLMVRGLTSSALPIQHAAAPRSGIYPLVFPHLEQRYAQIQHSWRGHRHARYRCRCTACTAPAGHRARDPAADRRGHPPPRPGTSAGRSPPPICWSPSTSTCCASIRSALTAPERDRFILSKGHSSIALYAVLALRGYFPVAELDSFDEIDSRLQGHPDMTALPGLEMSTGSLGQGLSPGMGMAIGAKRRGLGFRTYVHARRWRAAGGADLGGRLRGRPLRPGQPGGDRRPQPAAAVLLAQRGRRGVAAAPAGDRGPLAGLRLAGAGGRRPRYGRAGARRSATPTRARPGGPPR